MVEEIKFYIKKLIQRFQCTMIHGSKDEVVPKVIQKKFLKFLIKQKKN